MPCVFSMWLVEVLFYDVFIMCVLFSLVVSCEEEEEVVFTYGWFVSWEEFASG